MAGRYDVPAAKGRRAGGVYCVEITAAGEERTYSPAVGPGGRELPRIPQTGTLPLRASREAGNPGRLRRAARRLPGRHGAQHGWMAEA